MALEDEGRGAAEAGDLAFVGRQNARGGAGDGESGCFPFDYRSQSLPRVGGFSCNENEFRRKAGDE
jgi:hypothetical protein